MLEPRRRCTVTRHTLVVARQGSGQSGTVVSDITAQLHTWRHATNTATALEHRWSNKRADKEPDWDRNTQDPRATSWSRLIRFRFTI